ncbi:MAG: crossover junction endodeoxyribonuclease RuvC [Deltaproteobacteria bacterium]|nr:crossover junction endodeoxyribonuclease RuvC [Deltaproteobacteria bacterium]
MRVLGVDPGSNATGFGVVEKVGNRMALMADGVIRQSRGQSLSVRLKRIYDELARAIEATRPEEVAVESLFFARNPQSALKLGQARGVALLAAVNAGLPVFEYSALEVKKAVVGYGRAGKDQVQLMVGTLLNSRTRRSRDAADALAIAICHLLSSGSPLSGYRTNARV